MIFLLAACSYNITRTANHFKSPSYPSKYPNNLYCKYYFKVPNDNFIKISISSMNLEQSPSCTKDSIALYEGSTILQDRICGSRVSLSWTSKGNEVLLIFQADGTTSNYGFSGYLSAIKKRKFQSKIPAFSENYSNLHFDLIG